ncbi:MAG: hypothetical protein OEZ37_01140, partial [Gemmatimonadota bacterium]|nr:hypothetical protein [Gemmatimonadota bacterium]
FLADRPEIWGVRLRISETAAILLAAILAVWVVGPSVTLALRLLDRLPFPGVGVGLVRPGWKGGDVVVGAVTGLVVALMAVPFVGPGVSHPGAGAVVVEVAQALVDEVLLRLVLVTGVAWLFLRWHRVQGGEAAVVAVLVATASQVALYTPGALAVGFPDWTGTVAFLLAGVAVPAVAFGVLFWKKGFGAALAADATALLALLLIT